MTLRILLFSALIFLISLIHLPGIVQRVAFTALIFLIGVSSVGKRATKVVVFALSSQVFSAFVWLVASPKVSFMSVDTSVVLFANILWTAALVLLAMNVDLKRLAKPIKYVLLLHLFAFYLQFFLFYILGIDFRPFDLISAEQQRAESYGVIKDLMPIRAAGLFVEPSTYASVVVTLLGLGLLTDLRLRIIGWITVGSCVLTLSTLGFLLGFITALLLLNLSWQKVSLSFAIMASLVLSMLIQSSPENVVSFLMRLNFLQYLIDREFSEIILGTSVFIIDPQLYLHASQSDNNRFASLNDLGWFVVLFTNSGVLGVIGWLLLLYVSRMRLVFVLLSMTKLMHLFPLFLLSVVLNVKKR